MPQLAQEEAVLQLLQDRRSVLLIALSSGKDSDSMLTEVWAWACRHQVAADRIYTITADLRRSEWPTALTHIQTFSERLTGKAPVVVTRPQGDVLQQWWERYTRLQAQGKTTTPPFSDAQNRFCTSAAKRGQIHKAIIRLFPRDTTVIQAIGLRAAESSHRKKANTLKYHTQSPSAPTRNRQVYTWLPIHHFSLEDVWHSLGWTLAELEQLQADVQRRVTPGDYAGLERVCAEWGYQWGRAYALGNQRLSCILCPLASKNDLLNGIAWNPAHFRDIARLERQSGFSFQPTRWLSDLGIGYLSQAERQELAAAKATNACLRYQHRKPIKPQQLTLFQE